MNTHVEPQLHLKQCNCWNCATVWNSVPVSDGLTGKEFTFLIAAHMVLCFGFVAKPGLVMHQCFLVTAEPWPKGIPQHVTSCSAVKTRVRGRDRGGGCLQKRFLLRNWLGSSLLVGGSEWLPLYHLFNIFSPLSPSPLIKLSLSPRPSFLTFALPILSPVLLGERGASKFTTQQLRCWSESTHKREAARRHFNFQKMNVWYP